MSEEARALFGARVQEKRRVLLMTQRELATVVGVDQSVISKIERGSFNLRITTMSRIAQALGWTSSSIFAIEQ